MYLPDAFAENDPTRIAELVERHPFATLISLDGTTTIVSHLPLLAEAGPSGTLSDGRLIGHLARANPHARLLEQDTLAIFHGPHAYISPRWYRSPGVPTWNYAAVHIRGQARALSTPAETLRTVEKLTEAFESDADSPWTPRAVSDRLEQLCSAIVAFEISITAIHAKFKLSQNRPPADQTAIRQALEQQAPALARLMP